MPADRVARPRTLILACGALARELRTVLRTLAPGPADVEAHASIDVEYLPANLHNRPERIAGRIDAILTERAQSYERIIVAYGDCGTGAQLDAVLIRHGAVRIPGAHCYDFFAGAARFAALQEEEPGSFYLTDFLARHFDALVWGGLGLDRHPQLRDAYFGNYRRVVLLSQSDDPALLVLGRSAAERLGLAFEHRHVGTGPFAEVIRALVG